jgi:hypothetical protein
MIGTKQPSVLAAFYEKVLGKPADMVDEEHGFFGWQVGAAYLSVLEHSEMGGRTKDPGRVMINFETPQVKGSLRISLRCTVIWRTHEMEVMDRPWQI